MSENLPPDQMQQQIDPFVARAQQQAEKGAFTSEVAALKIFETYAFFRRAGLERDEAVTLSQECIQSELEVMRIHVDAKRVVVENEED